MSELSLQALFGLAGKKALVTGGASGVGRACAVALASGGADVAVLDLNAEAAAVVVSELREMGREAYFIPCDVSDEHSVAAAIDACVAHMGRLDIAVNSAGIAILGDDVDQSRSEWEKVIDVNLSGVWLTAVAAARQMIRQGPEGGKIINIASAGARTVGANGSYAASKAGVVHLTRTLAVRLGPYNINVNSLSPGVVMTPMVYNAAVKTGDSEVYRARLREVTPVGYVGRPQDLHGAVIYLASESSNYATGHDLLVDGGRTLSTWVEPLVRAVPPRVSPEEEIADLLKDLESNS